MKTIRAITIGVMIWIMGVAAYSLSFSIPLMENVELQANLTLLIAVIPLVWFGAQQYYKKDHTTHGLWIGFTFFSVAALLDALITVPFLIIPQGGSYAAFFGDPGFWLIGGVFLTTTVAYWYLQGTRSKQHSV